MNRFLLIVLVSFNLLFSGEITLPKQFEQFIKKNPENIFSKIFLAQLKLRNRDKAQVFYSAYKISDSFNIASDEQKRLINNLMYSLFQDQPKSVLGKRAAQALVAAKKVTKVSPENEKYLSNLNRDSIIGGFPAKIDVLTKILAQEHQFEANGVSFPKGILLYGPPGTGKTFLVKAVAGELDAAFIYVSVSSLITKWQGSGVENIRSTFELANKLKKDFPKVIIFFDELDAIGKERGEAGQSEADRVTVEMMIQLDGFSKNEESRKSIIIFASTNRKDSLDSALIRSGRFDYKIEVPSPDYEKRLALINYNLFEKVSRQIDELFDLDFLQELARKSNKMSCSDIERFIDDAAISAAIEHRGILKKDLEQAIDDLKKHIKSYSPPMGMFI